MRIVEKSYASSAKLFEFLLKSLSLNSKIRRFGMISLLASQNEESRGIRVRTRMSCNITCVNIGHSTGGQIDLQSHSIRLTSLNIVDNEIKWFQSETFRV